jgi:hypothetical protein
MKLPVMKFCSASCYFLPLEFKYYLMPAVLRYLEFMLLRLTDLVSHQQNTTFVFKQAMGRLNFLRCMVANIPRILSGINLIANVSLMC